MNTTNDLRHNIVTTDKDGNRLEINIRLNDECKNGHEDFAITGSLYAKDKPRNDRNMITAGCIHEVIEAARPDLKPFILLHLADANGAPMYAVANGFYHLENGFNNTPTNSPKFAAEFCEYYRITPEQFNVLKTSANKVQYAMHLEALNVPQQWKEQAKTAITVLEEMTGKKFKSTAVKSNFDRPTDQEIAEEKERAQNGYYSAKAVEERREKAKK